MLQTLLALSLALPAQATPPPAGPLTATVAELEADLARVPLDDMEREIRLVELLGEAGGSTLDVRSIAIDPALVAAQKQTVTSATRQRLAAAGRPQSEVEAAVAAMAARFDRLGGNVQAILPGRSKRTLLFAAHYDAVPGSQGIVDNWASCLLLARLARALRDVEREHTFWFVGFAGHELGGIGSASFVASLRDKMSDRIDACVTIDCAGAAPPMAWWTGSEPGTLAVVADVARRNALPLRIVDFAGSGSDGCVLRAAGLPAVSLLGLTPDQVGRIHGPGDRRDAIDLVALHTTHRLTVALATDLDRATGPLHRAEVRAKLRPSDEGEPAPLVPEMLDWSKQPAAVSAPAAAPPAKASANPAPSPASPPSNRDPRDGSPP